MISDLGYTAYADYFLGHKNNPYYTKSFEKEKEFFRKHIEQSLTLLDQSFIESKHADTQSKLENVEREYRELKANRRELEERLNRLEMSAKKFVKEKR